MQTGGWRNEAWLGQGLKYSTVEDLPVMKKQINLLLQIPSTFNKARPLPNLSMKTLLGRLEHVTQAGRKEVNDVEAGGEEIESEGDAIDRIPGVELLSPELPNTSLEGLFKTCILPWCKTIQEMNNEFGQRWLDGMVNSIVDWTDPDTRYPLAALTVYREFDHANDMRIRWRRAERWMNRGKRNAELASAIALTHKLMFVFEWSAELRAVSTTAHSKELIGMLSKNWLSDAHIDMLLEVLTERANYVPETADVLIAPCVFQQSLLHAYDQRDKENHCNASLLDFYRLDFQEGRKQRLCFVGHVNGNHWVPWKFDYTTGILGHGDSLMTPESNLDRIKKAMEWWISGIHGLDRQCTYKRNIMVHGDQGDTYSCGIVSYNAIAHDLFGDKLWSARNSKQFRIEAFNAIIQHHNASSANPQRELQVPLDSPSGSSSELQNRLSGKGLQLPPDSHRVVDPPSCALYDGRDQSPGMVQNKEDPLKKYMGSLYSSIVEVQRASSLAKLLHEDEETTLAKNIGAPGNTQKALKHDRGTNDLGTQERDDAVGEGEESHEKKRMRITDKGTLEAFIRPAKRPTYDDLDCNKEVKDEEATRGNWNCAPKHDQPESHGAFVGFSKSQLNSNKLRDAQRSGTLLISNAAYSAFQDKIHRLDPNARFNRDDWQVFCSRCTRPVKMRGPCDTQNFKIHLKACSSKQAVNTLNRYLRSSSIPQRLPNKPPEIRIPCSGLTEAHDSRIRTYLARMGALGGGGSAISDLAIRRFGMAYGDLDDHQRAEIHQIQESSWRWVVKHRFNAIFAVSCKQTVSARGYLDDKQKVACGSCLTLLHVKNFRQALRVPEPAPSDLKYVNSTYRNTPLGLRLAKCKGIDKLFTSDEKSVCIAVRYARGVADGEFKEHIIFSGLVEAVLMKLDRENLGLKMTNFRYPPAFAEFISTVHLLAPRAHKLLAEHFPVPSARNIQKQRAKEPQFTPGITSRSFDLVDQFVTKVKVPNRIIALSADDTKLLSTFRPFLNRETNDWYIVGGVGDPLLVSDPENLHSELERAQLKKATKVRIWVATVPFPKVPPIVIAAMAITDDVKADELTEYTTRIIDGLHERNIWTISYACDGTEKERKNQRNLRVQAHSSDTRRIQAPSYIVDDVVINIPLFHGRPVALVQDSLHTRKTMRNNIETGAKTMVCANHCILYSHLREMAFHHDSPLYHRDVEKGDKQDDRAAARVHSWKALKWLVENKPEYKGTIAYLFVFGELVDASQNRSIDFFERLRMVFRAKYFKEIWIKFLQEAGYPVARHCLSREALDITTYQTDGFLELLFIYRDYMSNKRLPLLPWLHSSEACEHMFGELRKQVKDFDFAAFLHLMPRTHWSIRYTMRSGQITREDAKDRARGYAHTWFDVEGLCLSNLSIFPNDEQISDLAKSGFRDAISIWEQLGLCLTDMRFKKQGHSIGKVMRHISEMGDSDNSDDDCGFTAKSKLPSLASLLPNPKLRNRFRDSLTDVPQPDSLAESKRAMLEQMIEYDEATYEHGPLRLQAVDDGLLNVTCAKLLLDFDTSLRIEEQALPTTEEWLEFAEECARDVGSYLADSLPPLVDTGERLRTITEASKTLLSPDTMLQMRQKHETQFSRKAVRTGTAAVAAATATATEDAAAATETAEALADDACEAEVVDSKTRHELIKKFHEILKLQQESGPGTGAERKLRWTSEASAGNAANAAATATRRASAAVSKRSRVYSELPIPRMTCQLLSDAGIGANAPLTEGTFGIIYHNDQLLIARVMAIYSKIGGENGRHGLVKQVTNIGQVSYIAVQTYEDAGNHYFKEIHSSLAYLSIASFAHILPFEFLHSLPGKPTVDRIRNTIKFSDYSHRFWMDSQRFSGLLSGVMKGLRKREKDTEE